MVNRRGGIRWWFFANRMIKSLKHWSGELFSLAQPRLRRLPLAPDAPGVLRRPPCKVGGCPVTEVAPASRAARSKSSRWSAAGSPAGRAESIYLVDDQEGLTELYTLFLNAAGYTVRVFHRRTDALAALIDADRKPELLITDYCGKTMAVEGFMQRCLAVHPPLRILMASGFCESNIQFSSLRPDRFIQKPFTADEFLREVRAALDSREMITAHAIASGDCES